MKPASLYINEEGVDVSLSRIPDSLREVFSYALEWCIGDDGELMEYIEEVDDEKKRNFVRAFMAKQDEIEQFCDKTREEIPVPDEGVVFDMAMDAYDVLLSMGIR